MLALRPARADEGPALTELCLRSKAVWGYDAAFMQACAPELALTSDVIASSIVHVAEIDGCVAGVAEIKTNGPVARLEKLFVEPGMLRAGIGRNLLDWAKVTARAAGATTLLIEADPDAAPFYRRMGAVDDGVVPSRSIPGRFIPRLNLSL